VLGTTFKSRASEASLSTNLKKFINEFEKAALLIAESPIRWPLYHRDVRRYPLTRFPYIIYYDIRLDLVRILRVVHASRDPLPIEAGFQ
jgi:plasmid stabilization system protein ParE